MQQILFQATDKDGSVKILGIKADCKITDLKILVNGVDITETVILEEVKIVIEKKEATK